MKAAGVSYLTDRLAPDAQHRIFSDVTPDPDVDTVTAGVSQIVEFQPDVVVALGGGSPIDAAKAIVFFAAKQFKMENCPLWPFPPPAAPAVRSASFL